jgi:hypothetical protein
MINGGLNVGDLVRVLATEDIMRSYPDYAHCTGIVIEIRLDEFYTYTSGPMAAHGRWRGSSFPVWGSATVAYPRRSGA